MIWQKKHLLASINQSKNKIQDHILQQKIPNATTSTDFRIGIIGGGPKGMYALENLIRKLSQNKIKKTIKIYWFNEYDDFGSGPNYQVDLPEYLLINYPIGHVDAWDRSVSNQSDNLSLIDWLRVKRKIINEPKPTEYASRALVGSYLQNSLLQILNSVPVGVQVFLIPQVVLNIHPAENQLLIVQTTTSRFTLNNVMLCTGHCYQNKPIPGMLSEDRNLPDLYFRHPREKLHNVLSSTKVGILGMGLTFIDVALGLTEGRGGKFDKYGNYIPSAEEPIMFPFSRNNIPILPRGPYYGLAKYRLYYINWEWINKLLESSEKIDFIQTVLPVFEQEVQFAYYSTLLGTRDEKIVQDYHLGLDPTEQFKLNTLLYPKIPKKGSTQNSYIEFLEFMVEEAEKGELDSPLMAAAAVWREASVYFSKLYQHAGLTGDSQKILDSELFTSFNRTSFGPPIVNMRKIISLAKAGIIQFSFDEKVIVSFCNLNQQIVLESKHKKKYVNSLIDARVARPSILDKNSPLYEKLMQQGLINPWDNDGYQPGCPAMNLHGESLGVSGKHLYFYGSNTEGVFLDNDTLSRKKNNLAASWVEDLVLQL